MDSEAYKYEKNQKMEKENFGWLTSLSTLPPHKVWEEEVSTFRVFRALELY